MEDYVWINTSQNNMQIWSELPFLHYQTQYNMKQMLEGNEAQRYDAYCDN